MTSLSVLTRIFRGLTVGRSAADFYARTELNLETHQEGDFQ